MVQVALFTCEVFVLSFVKSYLSGPAELSLAKTPIHLFFSILFHKYPFAMQPRVVEWCSVISALPIDVPRFLLK